MRKIILILFIIATLILSCGCYDSSDLKTDEKAEVIINLPKDNTVNGYRDKDFQKNTVVPANPVTIISAKDAKYFGNTSTKKFHSPNCSVVKNTKSENLYYAMDRDSMIEKGYTPCKKCNP